MSLKSVKVLGIDTSCDDTAVSLLEIRNGKFEILTNVVSSQVKLHAKYGGVYPFLAKREHQKNLPVVFKKAVQKKDFDLIAVTAGPGLEPCLWQGINFTNALAASCKKPLVPVNHIEAHMVANWLAYGKVPLPAICLVVSGGHTQLILVNGIGKYKLIGETRDDAAGECFDKVARILGLGYPGGPVIAQLAAKFKSKNNKSKIILPRPMMSHKNYDFSFSGLKTAVLYKAREGKYDKIEMCHEVQQSIIDVLIYKTIKAAKDFSVKSIILGGGVAANHELRKQFESRIKNQKLKIDFMVPPQNLCTDNAAMVAATAFFHRGKKIKNIKAEANLRL